MVEAVNMADLRVGDRAVFDPIYGLECVGERTEMWVGGVVNRSADGGIIGGPTAPMTSTPWIMLKFGLDGEDGRRFVLRFQGEPTLRTVP